MVAYSYHKRFIERVRAARSDGFDDWADMRQFWAEEHPGINEFSGRLIRWTPAP